MSSEIPVGSPPVPPGRHAAPGGWYPDPANPAQERYWDGWQWSRNTRPVENPQPAASPRGYQRPPYPPYPGSSPHPPSAYSSSATPGYGSPYGARPVPTTADGVPLAGWWWRALAIVIDAVIVGTVASLLSLPIYLRIAAALGDFFNESMRAAEQGLPMPPQPDINAIVSGTDQLTLTLVAFGLHTLYLVLFLRWRSATPGKMIVGLQVVPVDHGLDPTRLSWSAVTIRALVWTVPNLQVMLFLIRLIDVLMPLWNPKRQALHDLAAKTQVVKVR